MIVVDSSAIVHALVGRNPDPELTDQLAEQPLHAPHLLDIEVLNTLRGLLLGKKITLDQADDARHEYAELRIARFRTSILADRIWELRHNMTAYDASYVALAEALECPVATCDAKLVSTDHTAVVQLYTGRVAGFDTAATVGS